MCAKCKCVVEGVKEREWQKMAVNACGAEGRISSEVVNN